MLQGGYFDCSEIARERALRACRYVQAVEERSGAREVQRLLLGEIDPGELLAVAYLVAHPQALFMSGDLQWMRKISKRRFQSVRDLIAGRVLCLESMLMMLVERYGIAWVVSKFGAEPQHITLKILFGRGTATTEQEAFEGIGSYYRERKREFGEDFFYSGS